MSRKTLAPRIASPVTRPRYCETFRPSMREVVEISMDSV